MFYGSQTGTAEEFAGRIAKEGARYKMKGMVADPEECDMVNISLNNWVNVTKHIFVFINDRIINIILICVYVLVWKCMHLKIIL